MSRHQRTWAQLAPECDLGQVALSYWRRTGHSDPEYMRLTGNGCIAFGWRENLPDHTQQEHFIDDSGKKYGVGENRVSIIMLVKEEISKTGHSDNGKGKGRK